MGPTPDGGPRTADGCSRTLRRSAGWCWPLLQGTAAATVAWLIARTVFDHHQSLFAPISAVIALNTTLGERGLNALRLLQQVVVGIVVGGLTVAVLGGGYLPLALATFTAMAIAQATGGARIVVAQAAIGAILVVTVAQAEKGTQRLVDALIGTGVALVFSQLLFTPDPVRLVRRAEAAALAGMAHGLEGTSQALGNDDDERADRVTSTLRAVRDRLTELGRLREASGRITRHSLVWRSRRTPVVRENENAGHLDLLGGSCIMLARTALATSPPQRQLLAPDVRELADILSRLATGLSDRRVRQHAADTALSLTRHLSSARVSAEPALAGPIVALTMAATDTMVFAGVDPGLPPTPGPLASLTRPSASRRLRCGGAVLPGPDPGGLDDDLDAGVQVHGSGVDHQVVAVGLPGIPAVERDGHVGAELVLALLALRRPFDADAAVLAARSIRWSSGPSSLTCSEAGRSARINAPLRPMMTPLSTRLQLDRTGVLHDEVVVVPLRHRHRGTLDAGVRTADGGADPRQQSFALPFALGGLDLLRGERLRVEGHAERLRHPRADVARAGPVGLEQRHDRCGRGSSPVLAHCRHSPPDNWLLTAAPLAVMAHASGADSRALVTLWTRRLATSPTMSRKTFSVSG